MIIVLILTYARGASTAAINTLLIAVCCGIPINAGFAFWRCFGDGLQYVDSSSVWFMVAWFAGLRVVELVQTWVLGFTDGGLLLRLILPFALAIYPNAPNYAL